MIPTILIVAVVLACAIVAIARPHVGIIAFYGFYLLQPEWNWRWTSLEGFQHQEILAIATIIGTLFNFGRGNTPTKMALASYGCLWAFLILAFVSASQTINMTASRFYLDILWKAIFMSSLAAFHLDTPKKIVAMIWVVVLAQGYNAFQINLQYLQDGQSHFVQHSWGHLNSNTYSILTLPVIACSGALAVYSRHWAPRTIALAIGAMQIHQIMLLESRGCMFGGIAMALVFVINMPKSRGAFYSVATLVLAGVFMAGPSVVSEFQSSFRERDELDRSAQSRLELWAAGWAITMDHPVLGVGPFAGQYLVPRYRNLQEDDGRQEKALHNLFFEISTGCGLIAAILYVAHFLIVWMGSVLRYWSAGKEKSPLEIPLLAVIAGQTGFWVSSMFSSGALIESTYVLIAIGAAALCVQSRLAPRPKRARPSAGFHLTNAQAPAHPSQI